MLRIGWAPCRSWHHTGLARAVGLDEDKDEDVQALANLSKDWNAAINIVMEAAPPAIAVESTSARAALEIKEPEFKKESLVKTKEEK